MQSVIILRGNIRVKFCVEYKEVLTERNTLRNGVCAVLHWAVSITENSERE